MYYYYYYYCWYPLISIKLFQQCSENNCHQLGSVDEWTALPCEPSLCRPELWLRNVTERYSGLYKCSINPHIWDKAQAVDVQLVRTYQLDVKSMYNFHHHIYHIPYRKLCINSICRHLIGSP